MLFTKVNYETSSKIRYDSENFQPFRDYVISIPIEDVQDRVVAEGKEAALENTIDEAKMMLENMMRST